MFVRCARAGEERGLWQFGGGRDGYGHLGKPLLYSVHMGKCSDVADGESKRGWVRAGWRLEKEIMD